MLLTSIDVSFSLFDDLHMLVDSEIIYIQYSKSNTTNSNSTYSNVTKVKKLYKYRKNTPILVEEIGEWTKSNGYKDLEINKELARSRQNLMGTSLKSCLVITHKDSLNHLTDKR